MYNDKLEELIGKKISIVKYLGCCSITNMSYVFNIELEVLEIGEEIKENIFRVKCLDPSVADWDFTTRQWDWYELDMTKYGETWFINDEIIISNKKEITKNMEDKFNS